jgi:hypothetical protein
MAGEGRGGKALVVCAQQTGSGRQRPHRLRRRFSVQSITALAVQERLFAAFQNVAHRFSDFWIL